MALKIDVALGLSVLGVATRACELERIGADGARICAYFPGYEPNDGLLSEFVAAVRGASS